MALLSQIGSWFKRQFAAVPLMGGYRNPLWGIATKEVYPSLNLRNAVHEGFNSNAAVYSIVTRGATKFGSIPRILYDARKVEEKAVRERKASSGPAIYQGETDLLTLLNRPNPNMGQDVFLAYVWCFWQVCGEAFIWLNRGDTMGVNDMGELTELDDEAHSKKPVLEMYIIPSDQVIVVPSDTDVFGVYGYILESNIRIPLRKVDVIHWKKVNMQFDAVSRTHLRGMSPLQPGSLATELNSSTLRSMLRGVQNDGSKGALFNKTLGGKMTPEQILKLENVIDKKANYQDTKNAIATLQGDWGWVDFARTAVEMELIAGVKLSWQQLCTLFEFPYELIDPETTYANKNEAQKGWVSNCISPACKQLDNELNRVLLKAFGLDKIAFIGSDYSDLPEMQLDLGAMATALASAWWVTPNEKREMMMQEPIADPIYDEIWPAAGLSPRSDQEDAAMMEQQAIQYERQLNDTAGNRGTGNDPLP